MAASTPRTSAHLIDQALKRVTDQRSFIQRLLIDALCWKIPESVERVEDVAFGWSQQELRASELDKHLISGSVWQIQPLVENQPWGIFLLEFQRPDVFISGRGMTGTLRKVLRGLVPSRRKHADAKSWRREHLLFICTHEYNHFRFAYFKSPPDRTTAAPLAAFGWGPDIPRRTACEFNLPALVWPEDTRDTDDWIRSWAAAFDVEKVTKKFYDDYRATFEQVEGRIRESSGITNPDELRLFTQTLFNRLMFLRFIERKGWLKFPRNHDYLAALTAAGGIGKHSLYRSRIRPLFFDGLAVEGTRDSQAIGSVPFLNGGLFKETPLDRKARDVPDTAIKPMIGSSGLFYCYNFTAQESTPLDIEVAVDPEMLGKVFEELVTGRHETGSYYTPKPIVSFMCRQSLQHYLASTLPDESPDAIARFVQDHDSSHLTNAEAAFGAVRDVRVCDPACGSGAYLLGMLHELLELRTCLFVSRHLGERTSYARKLEIIENNLYGVDIDPFAVNMARLRLWLSLAVEYEGDEPPPLPNLDFKIEVGDSLAAPDPQSAFEGQAGLRDDLIRRFREKKAAFLLAHGKELEHLQDEVSELRRDLGLWLHSQAPRGAFDWATEFAEIFAPRPCAGGTPKPVSRGGFHIVVANPPYVRYQLIPSEYKRTILRRNFEEVYASAADLYVFFYARAHQILRDDGVGCFISSNKWLRSGYGEKLRCRLLDDQAVHFVADFGELPVFEAAATFPMIVVWQRRQRGVTPTTWAVVKDLEACYEDGLSTHLEKIAVSLPAEQFGRGRPRLASTIGADRRRRMEAVGQTLSDFTGQPIFNGIKTGLNEAFIIDRATFNDLVKQNPSSTELLKPLLVGDDVRRYEVHTRDRYLIRTQIGVNIRKYPAILKYLRQWQDRAEVRDARGNEWWELRPCSYYDRFPQPKIIYPDIGKECRFTIDEIGFHTDYTVFNIPTCDYYLLGVLNSNAAWEYLKLVCSALGDQEKGGRLRFYKQFLEKFPVPDAGAAERKAVARLAKEAKKLHEKRRKRVERWLIDCGIDPAQSNIRNRLEQPWVLQPAEFTRRARQGTRAMYSAAHDETYSLTEQITQIEAEIDGRVSALYGL